jgi:hypothetical protein
MDTLSDILKIDKNMNVEDLQKILDVINKSTEQAIEKHVNGKIRNMDKKLDEYIQEDITWKQTVQPIIEAYNTVGLVGTFTNWLSKVIISVGVIVAAIIGFLTYK